MELRTPVFATILGISLSCGPAAPTSPPAKATGELTPHGTATQSGAIGTYVSTPWGFSTSSYWIEGPTGLVAIDTQFLPSAAEEMIAKAEAMTKKKFVLAIVLHANPDKFNGTATFQKHGVKVITSAQVREVMPGIHQKRVAAFYDRYAPDYPKDLPQPEVFGRATMDLEAAGLKLRLHVIGAGCSESHVVVEHPAGPGSAIFVGDLVANKNHSWLEIGKTHEWIQRLEELETLAPSTVHPGRGPSGDGKLLAEEKAYLEKVIGIVAGEKPKLPIDDAALGRAERKIVDEYPGYGFPVFLKIGLPAEWERQARAKK